MEKKITLSAIFVLLIAVSVNSLRRKNQAEQQADKERELQNDVQKDDDAKDTQMLKEICSKPEFKTVCEGEKEK